MRFHEQSESIMNVLSIYGASTWFKVLQTTDRSQTAVMSLEPGQATERHAESDENSQQLLLLIEGKLLAEVDGERRTIAAGDLDRNSAQSEA
jgi:quercetin dioxygenase-like cupin family protein